MERLISELKRKIKDMKGKTNSSIDLSDGRLDDLYSVYPFNKFEYVISHLIATNTIGLQEYLNMRNSYWNATNICMYLKLLPLAHLVKRGRNVI